MWITKDILNANINKTFSENSLCKKIDLNYPNDSWINYKIINTLSTNIFSSFTALIMYWFLWIYLEVLLLNKPKATAELCVVL